MDPATIRAWEPWVNCSMIAPPWPVDCYGAFGLVCRGISEVVDSVFPRTLGSWALSQQGPKLLCGGWEFLDSGAHDFVGYSHINITYGARDLRMGTLGDF
jgi:hypothetical protein